MMMMTRSLSHYPAIPVLTIWACLTNPVMAQQQSGAASPSPQSVSQSRIQRGSDSAPVAATPRSRPGMFRRSASPDGTPAPRSATSAPAPSSRSATTAGAPVVRSDSSSTQNRSTRPQSSEVSGSSASNTSSRSTRRSPLNLLSSENSRSGRSESQASSRTSDAPAIQPVTADLDEPVNGRHSAPSATVVAANLDGARAIQSSLLSQSVPETLSPSESSKHLSGISRSLRSKHSVDPTIVGLASAQVAKISAALDAGCESLDPGCRVHARLIRRSLDSVSNLLSESADNQDLSKLHLALERLDSASRTLETLERTGN